MYLGVSVFACCRGRIKTKYSLYFISLDILCVCVCVCVCVTDGVLSAYT